jgi:hypothetical protein
MANSLLTISQITREALRLFRNTNAFLTNVNTQYDDSFAKSGAKIGSTLRIRLPNDYTVRTGAAASVQDTAEQNTTLTVSTQKGVDVSFSTADRALSLDDYSTRILAPMVNNLAGAVALDVMAGAEGGVANYVSNVDGSSNIITPTLNEWSLANAYLTDQGAPMGNRKIVVSPITMARTVNSFSTLFNPTGKLGTNYNTGMIGSALGFDWMQDQTVLVHATPAYSTLGTVSGANQTGSTIVTSALAGPLSAGDIITFALVNGVNRVTKGSYGRLRQFVVTANVAAGATSIPIYPALIPASSGNQVQYQTVDVSPANGAAITVVSKASESYRKNIAFIPEAVTLATADLELPKGVHEAHRETYAGVSMRMVTAYNIATDQMITRMDVLYGYKWLRPEWAVVVADKL